MNACPDRAALERFLAGEPDPTVADHLEACETCRQTLDRLSERFLPPPSSSLAPSERTSVDTFLNRVKSLPVPDPHLPIDRKAELPPPEVPGYDIVAELGRGGMGVVYKAVHRPLNRNVALKMILAGVYPTDEDRGRFRAEAEAIARLQHPNIVQLFEFGEAGGRPFLTLEYVSGGTLQQRAGDRPQKPISAARVVEVLARAVGYAHARQIVHRDLKPGNVLLAPASHPQDDCEREYGTPKLTDFGLAKRMDATHPSLSKSVTGTPSYMAPEQVPEGLAPGTRGAIGPATDVYALGAMLYYLLAGHPPFSGPDWMTTLLQTVRRDPIPLRILQPEVPRDLDTICLKCLEKEAGRRYPTAEDLADDLARFLAGKPILARPVGALERGWKWTRRHPVAATAVGVAFGGLSVAVVGLAVALEAVDARRAAEVRTNEGLRDRERQANIVREREEKLRVAAEQGLYFGKITQANLLWRESDLGRARQVLADCPPGARRWEWKYLNRLCHDGLIADTLGPGVEAEAVAFGPGWVAVAGSAPPAPGAETPPGTLLVLTDDGETLARSLVPVAGTVIRLAAVPDSRRLVALVANGSGETTLVGWEIPARREAGFLPHAFSRTCGKLAVLAPDGDALAIAADGQIAVTDLRTNAALGEWKDTEPITAMALSAHGTRVVVSTARAVAVREIATGVELARWTDVAANPTIDRAGDRIAYLDADGTAVVRRVGMDARPQRFRLKRSESVRILAFSADGSMLIATGSDGLHRFDLDARGVDVVPGTDGVRTVSAFPAGRSVAAAGDDGTVRVAGIADNLRLYRAHAGPVRAVAVSPDARRLATAGQDGAVRVWDLARDQVAQLSGDGTAVEAAASMGDGSFVELGRDFVAVREGPGAATKLQIPLARGRPEFATPHAAAFAPAASLLFTVDPARQAVEVRDLARGAGKVRSLIGHEYPIVAVAASADGRTVATGSAGLKRESGRPQPVGEVLVWDGVTGELRDRRTAAELCVCALAVSPDGRTVAVATGWPGWDRAGEPAPAASLRTFLAPGGPLRRPLSSDPKGGDPFFALAFHPGGGVLAATSLRRAGTVFAFDVEETKVLWETPTGDRFVGLATTADGSRVLAANRSGSVTLFDALGGTEVLRLAGPSRIRSTLDSVGIAVSPDGRFLAAPCDRGAFVWEASENPNADRREWRKFWSRGGTK